VVFDEAMETVLKGVCLDIAVRYEITLSRSRRLRRAGSGADGVHRLGRQAQKQDAAGKD
jgi:hypothetical protein